MLTLANPEMIEMLPKNLTTMFNVSGEDIEICILKYVKSAIVLPRGVFLISMYVLYSALFLIGVFGNCWLISVTVRLVKLPTVSNGECTVKRFYAYCTTLSLAHLLVVLTIPFMIYSVTVQHWMFGLELCKTYYIAESFNKFLSIFVLAILSFERYTAICRKGAWRFTLLKSSGYCTLFVVITTSLLLIPIYVYAGQYSYEYLLDIDNVTFSVEIAECALRLEPRLMTVFVWYTFALGFCLPTCFVLYFYLRIIAYVYMHSRTLTSIKSQVPLKRVTVITFLIVLFYCFSWGPYWCTMLYNSNTAKSPGGGKQDETNWYVYFAVHTLVYVNASFNWILYAFLNKNLNVNRYSDSDSNNNGSGGSRLRHRSVSSRTATLTTSFTHRRTAGLSPSSKSLVAVVEISRRRTPAIGTVEFLPAN